MSMRQWISKAYEQCPHGKMLLGRAFANYDRHPHENFLLGSRMYAADAAAKPDVVGKASKIAEKPVDEAGHDAANAVTGAPRTSEAAPSDPIGEEMRPDTFVSEDIEVKHEGQWADTIGNPWDNVVSATKRVVGGAVDKIKEVAAGSDNSVADTVGGAAGDAAAGPAAGAVAGGAAAAAAESMGADKHKDVKSEKRPKSCMELFSHW